MSFVEEFDEAIKIWTNGNTKKTIESVFDRPNSDIYEFSEILTLTLRKHFIPNKRSNKNFSFIANSSLSGGRHPCSNPECRIKKLNELVSFSSLYADEVYIGNPFEKMMFKDAEEVHQVDREELISGILNFYFLKPLFEKGIIKYAQNIVSLCQFHKESLADPLSEQIERKENLLYEFFHDYLTQECSIVFDFRKEMGPFFEISGPENLIEHGKRYFYLYQPFPKFVNSFMKRKLPYKVPKREIIDKGILSFIISPFLRDLSDQEWHSTFYGTSYLSDNAVQMRLASRINSEEYAANSSVFERCMSHYLPAVYGRSIQEILELREQEGEAFAVYRDRLSSLIRKEKAWEEKDLSQVFRDEVLPEINLIEKKIRDWKSKTRESLKEKLIFGSGAITVGLYSGVLPPDIGQIVAALGGGSAVIGALIDYNKTLKEKDEARASDFYFLWQAKQK